MKRFTVKIPCRSGSEAARIILLAQRLKPKEERMTQMAISKNIGVTVQCVNEQRPTISALIKRYAKA